MYYVVSLACRTGFALASGLFRTEPASPAKNMTRVYFISLYACIIKFTEENNFALV